MRPLFILPFSPGTQESIKTIYKRIASAAREEASDKEIVNKLSKHSRLSSSGQVLLPEIASLEHWRNSVDGFDDPASDLDKWTLGSFWLAKGASGSLGKLLEAAATSLT